MSLAVHAESLTLVAAHAVLLRTMDPDVPRKPTCDGDHGWRPTVSHPASRFGVLESELAAASESNAARTDSH